MSWTDIFQVCDDEMIARCMSALDVTEKRQYDEWFGIQEIVYPANQMLRANEDKRPIVSSSLFWKHVNGRDPDLPEPSRYAMVNATRLGLVKRFAPWESYVAPLFLNKEITLRRTDIRFIIYLANDLKFLAEELAEVGWEVAVMKSSSVRFCPGGLWRFLALGENSYVTMIDTDRIAEVEADLRRTELIADSEFGLWRVPGYYNAPCHREVRYRPMLAGNFGAKGGLEIRPLLETFVWSSINGLIKDSAEVPGYGERPIKFAQWPDYGFDEIFLLVCIFPRLVTRGVLSFVPKDARSMLLPLDIEYCSSANSNSEICMF